MQSFAKLAMQGSVVVVALLTAVATVNGDVSSIAERLLPSPSTVSLSQFGAALSVSDDTLAASVIGDGTIRVFQITSSIFQHAWSQTSIISGSGAFGTAAAATTAQFGSAVALAANSTTLVVGASAATVGSSALAGRAFVFVQSANNSSWLYNQELVVTGGAPAGARFGR